MVLAAVLALALVPGALSAPDAGSSGEALEIALAHVGESAADLGVTTADVGDLFVTSNYTSRHNRVTHVNLNQRFRSLEVFGGHVTVSVAADGEVVFASGSLVRGLAAGAAGTADLAPAEAVEAAAEGLDLAEPAGLRVIEGGPVSAEAVLTGGGISDEPIPARLGWQPTKDGLRLAWQLVIDDSSDVDLWNATVDAETGELLDVDNWTSHASPNPANDGASYRVFAFPKVDPNDGPQTLETNPADALASPFGWHDTDGVSGPEFTVTRGNNVHAYSDRDANNQPDPGSEPEGGPTLTFDYAADLGEHPQNYTPAAVTNLFYWCNMVHDVTYQYGFDEASGNFQVNNYDRGGAGGDDVRCEAQDGGGENNANFSTPAADGGRPRMQMFIWPGNQFGFANAVTVDAPSSSAGVYTGNYARFTPAPTTAGVSGQIVLVNDGSASPSEGCGPLVGFPAGAIALVDRGTCTFYAKVANAEAAGASAIVIANNTGGNPPVLTGSMDPPVGIPAMSVTQADGAAIKAGLPAAGSVHRNRDRPPMRDADFRQETIFHEYGHGVSLRLTGGPGVNCLSGNEQAGEGWSDYLGIVTLLNPEIDQPHLPRGYGQYALFADTRIGPGFRPRPYSRNMEIQPFTYDSIKTGGWLNGASLALPHGLGHGWAAVLWDMTWDLIDKHGFNPNVYANWDTGGNNRSLQYVIDGLKLQGCGPGLVVARDAIIASQEVLTGGTDSCTLWASFARRGLGFSAVQGTTNRNDNDEAFDTHPDCLRGFHAPVHGPYGTLNEVDAGDAVPLRFRDAGLTGLDILASDSPYSRQVDCETLRTVDPESPFITPRPFPVPTATPGNSKLTVNANGVYTYPWKTLEEWAGTCRELVLTRDDGVQHRSFFRFL